MRGSPNTMNEFILNIAGFTLEEWRAFKGRIANKLLSYWRRVASEVTLERLRAGFLVFFVAGLFLFGVRQGLKFLSERRSPAVEPEQEATQSASPQKNKLEVTLEKLKSDLETALEPQADLEYPSLDLKVSFD